MVGMNEAKLSLKLGSVRSHRAHPQPFVELSPLIEIGGDIVALRPTDATLSATLFFRMPRP